MIDYYIKKITRGFCIMSMALIFFLPGCADIYKVKERELRIRYINIKLVYEYMVKGEPEPGILMKKKRDLQAEAEEIDKRLQGSKDKEINKKLLKEKGAIILKLGKIKEQEKDFKSKILNEINRGISNVAKEGQYDYVFNIGDALVFSRKDYDVTEDVIREIIRLKKRNAPVSR